SVVALIVWLVDYTKPAIPRQVRYETERTSWRRLVAWFCPPEEDPRLSPPSVLQASTQPPTSDQPRREPLNQTNPVVACALTMGAPYAFQTAVSATTFRGIANSSVVALIVWLVDYTKPAIPRQVRYETERTSWRRLVAWFCPPEEDPRLSPPSVLQASTQPPTSDQPRREPLNQINPVVACALTKGARYAFQTAVSATTFRGLANSSVVALIVWLVDYTKPAIPRQVRYETERASWRRLVATASKPEVLQLKPQLSPPSVLQASTQPATSDQPRREPLNQINPIVACTLTMGARYAFQTAVSATTFRVSRLMNNKFNRMIFLKKIESEIGARAYVEFQASVAENKSFAKVILRKFHVLKRMIFLRKIASEIRATAYVEFQTSVAENKSFAKVIVRKGPKADQNCQETRIALLGNKDAGKSTLIHVLLKGMLDDGHGSRCEDALKRLRFKPFRNTEGAVAALEEISGDNGDPADMITIPSEVAGVIHKEEVNDETSEADVFQSFPRDVAGTIEIHVVLAVPEPVSDDMPIISPTLKRKA
ncbi:hypothetical protein QYM36_004748, partial [Artemia franciscana]